MNSQSAAGRDVAVDQEKIFWRHDLEEEKKIVDAPLGRLDDQQGGSVDEDDLIGVLEYRPLNPLVVEEEERRPPGGIIDRIEVQPQTRTFKTENFFNDEHATRAMQQPEEQE